MPLQLLRTRSGNYIFSVKALKLHLLFVCTGNICRSPTAERLMAAFARELSVENLVVSSAGTRAVVGQPIHPEAARVLEGLGGDTSGFAARQLTARIAEAADLILTMTAHQRDAVLEHAPRLLRRTFTLSEASRLAVAEQGATMSDLGDLRAHVTEQQRADIRDPIGGSAEVFQEVGARIASLLPPIVDICVRSGLR